MKRTINIPKASRGPRGRLPEHETALSREVRTKRLRLGLTQEQCIEYLAPEISVGSWHNVEQGHDPPVRSRVRIAIAAFLAHVYRVERRADGKLTIIEL